MIWRQLGITQRVPPWLLVLQIVSVFHLCGARARAQRTDSATSESVAAMYGQLAASLSRLTSAEFRTERVITSHLPLPEDSPLTPVMRYHVHYVMQRNLVYCQIDDLSSERDDVPNSEGAYNGEFFQILESGVLQVQSNRPERFPAQFEAIQPIVVPFDFAFEHGDDIQFTTLLNEGTWQRLAAKSRQVRVETVNGRTCDVVEVDKTHVTSDATFVYEVFLDREFEYYPVKWVLNVTQSPGHDGAAPPETIRTEGAVQLLAYETSNGRVLVPDEVTVNVYWGAQLGRTVNLHVDPATVRINQPVDESIFNIDESRATSLVDRDARTTRVPGAKPVHRNWHLVIVPAVLLLLVSVTLLWRIRAK